MFDVHSSFFSGSATTLEHNSSETFYAVSQLLVAVMFQTLGDKILFYEVNCQ